MPSEFIYALIAAAVLMFWIVGAYNRLTAMRNDIGAAWAKIDESLKARATAATPLLAALQEPMTAEAGALDAVQAALRDAAQAANAMGSKPMVEAHAAAFATAESNLSAASTRLLALIDQHAELRFESTVAEGTLAWRDANSRLSFARQLFNEATQAYNAAIAIFPTRWLVSMFRFDKAGRI